MFKKTDIVIKRTFKKLINSSILEQWGKDQKQKCKVRIKLTCCLISELFLGIGNMKISFF